MPVLPGRALTVSVVAKTTKESRIGVKPIPVPKGVTVTINGQHLSVKGPKGQLERDVREEIKMEMDGDNLVAKRVSNHRTAYAYHGLSRSLAANMVEGVSNGFEKSMTLVGVGYRANMEGNKLGLSLGLSHPVSVDIPEGLSCNVNKNTEVVITGIDKEAIGTFCATLRNLRPPEPYGGKGIRYTGENIQLKEGKSGK